MVLNDEKIIRKSKFFKEQWYLKTYKDVSETGLKPWVHYLQEGWKKGYVPSRQFDTEYYFETYPEVEKENICPLLHYETRGKGLGYFPNVRAYYKSIWKQNGFSVLVFLRFGMAKLGLMIGKKPDYLSLLAIVKNEAPYIKEWVDYYLLQGVTKFYIYDNESQDNLKEVLKPYVEQKVVELIDFPGKIKQVSAYNDAISKYRYKTQWLMIVDADEFMVPVGKKRISDLLKDYEKYAALAVNWVMYDCGGCLKKPEGLVMENYKTVHGSFHPKNLHVKSIVNPRKVKLCVNPHYCEYRIGNRAVDENFEKVTGPTTSKQSISKIRINHYYCKSYEEYEEKVRRGRSASGGNYDIKKEDYWYEDAKEDYVMSEYVAKLKMENQ